MAFTAPIVQRIPLVGDPRYSIGKTVLLLGTYENTSGSTGGTIATGLGSLFAYGSNNNTQSATANLMTASGGDITLTTIADEDGTWWAIGTA